MNEKTISQVLPEVRLLFNIQNPTLEECWLDGYQSANEELAEEADNPFPKGSKEYFQWQEGWWAGFYGEEPLFSTSESPIMVMKPGEKVHAVERLAPSVTDQTAANESLWQNPKVRKWAGNVAKVTGILAASVVGYQLLDMVV